MGAQTQEVFGRDADFLIQIYIEHNRNRGNAPPPELEYLLSKYSVERDVRLGRAIAQHNPRYFVEVGCGLAIPSFTLMKMGINSGEGIDRNPDWFQYLERMKSKLGLDLNVRLEDFYEWDPDLPEGTFIIAEEPWENQNRVKNLEEDILRFVIERGLNLALLPTRNSVERSQKAEYEKRFQGYIDRLGSEGYDVTTADLSDLEGFDYTVIIATK